MKEKLGLYLGGFLLAAVSVSVIFLLLLGLPFLLLFVFLLLFLLPRAIVAGQAVRVLAIGSFSVRVSLYITVLRRQNTRDWFKNSVKQGQYPEVDTFTHSQSSCVSLLWQVFPLFPSSLCPSSSWAVLSSGRTLSLISLPLHLQRKIVMEVKKRQISQSDENWSS